MATFTLENIPDDLLNRLRSAAKLHHRSINGEILARLERSLGAVLQPAEAIDRARGRSATAAAWLRWLLAVVAFPL
jgi:plasmid stability protein